MELERFFRIYLISPDGNTRIDIPNQSGTMGIVSGSLNLNELICDSEFEIGNILSNKFEVQIYGLREDVSGYWIILSNTYYSDQSPTVREQYWFKGIVDSSKTDNKNMDRTIVAYDYSYSIRDLSVSNWWSDFWTHNRSATLATIRNSLCSDAGLTVAATQPTITNDTIVFGADGYTLPTINSSDFKFATLLRWICELQGCCPNVSRTGYIEFIPMSNLTTASALDISDEWAKNDATFEDYTTTQIEGITITDSSSNIIQVIPSVAQVRGSNTYTIINNPFLIPLSYRERIDILSPVIQLLRNVNYVPAEIPLIISNYDYKPGQLVMINDSRCGDTVCIITYHFVLNQTYSGPQLVDQTIESVSWGSHLRRYSNTINDPIIL